MTRREIDTTKFIAAYFRFVTAELQKIYFFFKA